MSEERPSNIPLEPSRTHTSSVTPSNRYNWIRENEHDPISPGFTLTPNGGPAGLGPPSDHPRESSPERLSRRSLGIFRTSGESLSDLIRRRTARVDAVSRSAATASVLSSRRSPSLEAPPRIIPHRLLRPSSRFGDTDNTTRDRELSIDQEAVIPDYPNRSHEHIVRNRELFEPQSAFRFENSSGDTRQHRRSQHRRAAEFAEEPVVPPRPVNMPFDLLPESETLRAARERTQLREAIGRRGRQDEVNPHRLVPSTFERTRSLIHRDPLSDEHTRTLQRRLRESEAEMSRALQALDRWGELEATTEHESDTAPSRLHRLGETFRRGRLSSGFPFASNNETTFPEESSSMSGDRPPRRSPSPLGTATRHQVMQTRWARAQSRFRELGETQGEHPPRPPRSRNAFLDFAALRANRVSQLEEYFRPRPRRRHIDDFHFPFHPPLGTRNLGDYVVSF